MKLTNSKIPSVDLIHNQERVSFAFRTMDEIHEQNGPIKDLPHRHDYFTILWAGNACGDHYIDYKHYLIRPNRIFFVNPGQVHQVITYGKPEGYVLMFSQEFLQQNHISEDFLTNLGLFSDSADTPPIQIDEVSERKLSELINNIQIIFNSVSNFKQEQISSYLKLFLIECNKFALQLNISNTQTVQSSRIILGNFKKLVENNFNSVHKVAFYSEQLHITSDYLNSVVKGSIGKTAKEFIQNRICLEAKRLGVHTQLTSKEIAFELGFEDPSHFSKFFKSTEGVSFTDFRSTLTEVPATTL